MKHRIRDADVRRIVQWALQLGFTLESGRKHSKLIAPGSQRIVVFGRTPSDYRAAQNFRHQVIRAAREAGIAV